MALSTLFSGIHAASSFFQKIFPVPGFISSLSSLQALLGFGGWTVALVTSYVTFRVIQVALGKRQPNSFPSGKEHEGPQWYQRAIRAHANCIENLPLVALGVFADQLTIKSPEVRTLATGILFARILQSIAAISSGRSIAVHFRAVFYVIQIVFLLDMYGILWQNLV